MPKRSGNGIIIKNIGAAIKKAAPTILTIVGSAGVVVTAILTAKAGPKATKRIEEAKAIKGVYDDEPLTKIEAAKACWKCYIPSAIAGTATIGMIFCANLLNKRQQASLTAAYAFIDRSYRGYQKAVKEVFGEEGHNKVMQSMLVEHPDAPAIYGNLYGESFDFGETNDERHLFYDAFSKRYFSATFSDVLLAELHTNRNFAIDGYSIPLSMFYEFLGLDTPDELKELCWYRWDEYGDYNYYFIDFTHTQQFIDDGPDKEPIECWVIEMIFPPTLEPDEG